MGKRNKVRWGHIEELIPGEKHRIWWEGDAKPNGKRKQPSKTIYGTWEDAELELAKIFIQRGGVLPDMTYEELWGGVIVPSFDKYDLAVRTREDNIRVWEKELEPRIAKDVVHETTGLRVEEVLAEIDSPWVQKSAFSLWRKMINLALHNKKVDMINPCTRYVYRKKAVPKDRPLLQAHEVMDWMASIRGIKYEPLLLAEVGCGPRVEEACALLAEDFTRLEQEGHLYYLVDINKALVSSRHGRVLKGMKTDDRYCKRVAAIGEPFSIRLDEILPKSGPLCPSGKSSEDGIYLAEHYTSPATVSSKFKAFCDKRGIKYVNPGKLRKSWSTMQGEAKSEDSLVSLAMGHSDGTTRGANYQTLTRSGALMLADNLSAHIKRETAKASKM